MSYEDVSKTYSEQRRFVASGNMERIDELADRSVSSWMKLMVSLPALEEAVRGVS